MTITATPSKPRFLPGETGSFDVLAVDYQGKPVEADLSFGEVDEALYSVRPDESGNIVNAFYPKRRSVFRVRRPPLPITSTARREPSPRCWRA